MASGSNGSNTQLSAGAGHNGPECNSHREAWILISETQSDGGTGAASHRTAPQRRGPGCSAEPGNRAGRCSEEEEPPDPLDRNGAAEPLRGAPPPHGSLPRPAVTPAQDQGPPPPRLKPPPAAGEASAAGRAAPSPPAGTPAGRDSAYLPPRRPGRFLLRPRRTPRLGPRPPGAPSSARGPLSLPLAPGPSLTLRPPGGLSPPSLRFPSVQLY